MSNNTCRVCHSYAINPGHHGRPPFSEGVDHDLCDVCYWRKRAGGLPEAPGAPVAYQSKRADAAVWKGNNVHDAGRPLTNEER